MALIDPSLGAMPKPMFARRRPPRTTAITRYGASSARLFRGRTMRRSRRAGASRGTKAFGMTESGLDIAVELDDHDETVGTGCVGTPMPGREARVVDAEDRPVPPVSPVSSCCAASD